jgi:hypothetical protein
MKTQERKLRMWQERYTDAKSSYQNELSQMDEREELYKGTETIKQITCRDFKKETKHVRNICMEIIESQVNSSIPQPKVTARRREDEALAKIIEDMLRNEVDRLPFEVMNDQLSRTVPIQGGAGFLVEWDESKRTHVTSGEIVVTALHPKMIIPQDGILTGVEDMDYIFVVLPQTKEYIKSKYGVSVYKESEEQPDIRGGTTADELVTQITCYFRNDKGGIGKFSWAGDTVLEDLDNYQARRIKRCVKCGAIEPMDAPDTLPPKDYDPDREEIEYLKRTKPRKDSGKVVCPYCGSSKWEEDDNDFEELSAPLTLSNGTVIPPFETWDEDTGEIDELGQPVVYHHVEPKRIPYYCPKVYPVIPIKNTSMYGKFLGGSDIDILAYQQNTTNRLSAKIADKLYKSGSYITLPVDAKIQESGEDSKVIRIKQPSEREYIGVYDMEGNIQQDMAYLDHVYEEARQMIGVTDSFQGRNDPTATSGKAKEFAAAQSAGRLESKRVMRDWAWSELFRLMFMFKLAYADEPRPVVSHDSNGDVTYKEFNRYDFLRQDDAGNYYWVDDFIFSCDVTAPLANNREAMWQETRLNFQQGTFGPPQDLESLIMFWTKMAELHYPGAEDTRDEMRRRLEQQLMQQQMMMQQQMQIEQAAKQQAMRDAGVAPAEDLMPPQDNSLPMPPNMQMAIDNMELKSDRYGGML